MRSAISFPRTIPRAPAELIALMGAFIAISFAVGVTAREAGFSLEMAVLMSALVYAGTSQVVALGMLVTGQPGWVIVVVTLLINSRMLLMSTVFAQKTLQWKPLERLLLAIQLTDETFALLLPTPGKSFPPFGHALTVQMGAYGAWVAGTAFGHSLEASSTLLRGLGLDFALVAMLIAVLILQLHDRKTVWVALFSGLVSLIAVKLGLAWGATLIAAAIAPLLGIYLEKRCQKSS